MEFVLFITGIVLFAATYILRTIYYTHMFQLNSYKPPQQLKWLGKNKKSYLLACLPLVACALPAFITDNLLVIGIAANVLFAVSLILSLPKKAKKPLVYTKRVWRLLATCFVLLAAVTAIIVFAVPDRFAFTAAAVVAILTPFTLLLCNLINQPVEKAINRHFINDAKKIIRNHKSLITVGVTGSYGKTSVKFMLGTLLEAKYNVLITPESYNTTLGVTRVIRESLRATHDIFVCEMGAKQGGDIKEICDIALPTHGVITSIGPQHLETFKSLDNVKKTKFELADSLPAHGKLFLNGEDKNIADYNRNKDAITYGLTPDCDYFANNLTVTADGTVFTVEHNGESVSFTTSLIGRHNVINLVGAIAVSCELGVELNRLPPYVRKVKAVEHRLQLTKRGTTTVIDDAYNSNPSGAKAALDALALFDGYKVIVTPGMIELGAVQDEENLKFGANIADVCDFAVLVGKKQTESIYKGLVSKGFDKEKIYVADNLNDAAKKAFELQVGNRQKIVLFENDLPDNY